MISRSFDLNSFAFSPVVSITISALLRIELSCFLSNARPPSIVVFSERGCLLLVVSNLLTNVSSVASTKRISSFSTFSFSFRTTFSKSLSSSSP